MEPRRWPRTGRSSLVSVCAGVLSTLAPVPSSAAEPPVATATPSLAGKLLLPVVALGLALGGALAVEVAELTSDTAGDPLNAVLATLAAHPRSPLPPVAEAPSATAVRSIRQSPPGVVVMLFAVPAPTAGVHPVTIRAGEPWIGVILGSRALAVGPVVALSVLVTSAHGCVCHHSGMGALRQKVLSRRMLARPHRRVSKKLGVTYPGCLATARIHSAATDHNPHG